MTYRLLDSLHRHTVTGGLRKGIRLSKGEMVPGIGSCSYSCPVFLSMHRRRAAFATGERTHSRRAAPSALIARRLRPSRFARFGGASLPYRRGPARGGERPRVSL